MMLIALALAALGASALNNIGPCHGAECPNADIRVCHNPNGNTGVTLRDFNTNPPSVRHLGLGMGSTKKVGIDSVEFYPCGTLTWNDVMSCADIWYTCLN